jgi:type VI secretion system protein ImpL
MKVLHVVFGLLLTLAVWGLWWWLDLPLWLAILATVVIVLVLVATLAWGLIRARRAAAKIEQALARQGAAQVAGARPDLQADIRAMSSEFDKAVLALKTSKLGKQALYALPWYVIIGPPGVGKSTALRNSGLQFPYLGERGGGAVKGIGGTRNCDWWMTNQAVIVDTAGRYTTDDGDRDEWLAFLDLLADTRPKRPLNGVLLAVSVADLALASETELDAMATKIRARIDEVTTRLEMSVPVYVLFTKCDLLPGFVEMFSAMGKTERQQIWGFTLPVADADAQRDPIGSFCAHFDRLADRAEQRSLRRLGEERRLEARAKIYEFPQHFELLRDNLASFIGMVFTANIYAETPVLRGCYFTSGTQEGRPIDRLMGAMAEAFGLRSDALLAQAQVEARSYFLGQLFNKVVFADRELARRSSKHQRRAAMLEWAGAGLILSAAIGLCVLPIRSMRANQAVLARVHQAVGVIEDTGGREAGVATLERLAPIHAAATELHGYEHVARPLELRFGMYQGDALAAPTRALFGRTVRAELIDPWIAAERVELQNFASRYPSEQDEPPTDESSRAFDSLRVYLLLAGDYLDYRGGSGGGAGAGAGAGAEADRAAQLEQDRWLAEQLARAWANALLVEREGPRYAAMQAITRDYVTLLREQPQLQIERDEPLVAGVREVLRRADRTEAWLAELIDAAREVDGVKDLSLATLKIGTDVYKNDGVRIRGAFTRQGWEKYARGYLSGNPGEFVGNEWVIGLSPREARDRQLADRYRLRSRYFDQYIKEWDQFIAKIYVDAATDLVGSLTMFQALARGGSPLRALLNQVAWHTTLAELPRDKGDLPWFHPDKLTPGARAQVEARAPAGAGQASFDNRDVRRHFEPFVGFGIDLASTADSDPDAGPPPVAGALAIDSYQEQLTAVRDALQAAVDDSAELDVLAKKLKLATQVVKGQISEQQEPWRSRFDRLLRPPFDAVRGVVDGDRKAGLDRSWCSAVYQPFAEQVAGKYPFDKRGYDLPLAEFTAWFGPEQGPVWEFYAASLANRIERNASSFRMVDAGAGSTIDFNSRLPAFFTRYADLGAVMFPPGSSTPRFEFEVQIDGTPGVSEIILTVDGQQLSYRNGPQQWKPLVWPGTAGDPGASIRAKGLGKNGEVVRAGEWGLWRLLGEAKIRGAAGQQVYSVAWDLGDQQVGVITIRLRPKRAETPLFGVPARGSRTYLGLFEGLEIPRTLVSDHACAAAGARASASE